MVKNYVTYNGYMAGKSKKTYNYEVPYFVINGHYFKIKKDSESKSELNIVKTKMYVPTTSWGYNDIQFVNFTGEEMSIEVYSRVTEVYTGDSVHPEKGALKGFYSSAKTPHAVLKYWAQCGVTCEVETNLQAYESGDYIITEFSQSSPEYDLVVTNLTLTQYETSSDVNQTYWRTGEGEVSTTTTVHTNTATGTDTDTQAISATAIEINSLGDHRQTCKCDENTPFTECTTTYDAEVETIQRYLRQWGYFPFYTRSMGVLSISGRYCYYTTQAVASLQADNNLPITGEFNSGVKNVFLQLAGVSDTSSAGSTTVRAKTNSG